MERDNEHAEGVARVPKELPGNRSTKPLANDGFLRRLSFGSRHDSVFTARNRDGPKMALTRGCNPSATALEIFRPRAFVKLVRGREFLSNCDSRTVGPAR